ncbi:MAG: GNAT family N-acetyltransferase [Kordiimonas sp.]|nr:GNAT family N-acetyltransferase [Kordiimonas sp.]
MTDTLIQLDNDSVATIDQLIAFEGDDLEQLCEVTIGAIKEGAGFNWLVPPAMSSLEAYWKGVLLIPDRRLYVVRLNGRIAGAFQLVRPPSHNEAGAFRIEVMTFFLGIWARGQGLSFKMMEKAEQEARLMGCRSLDVNMRANNMAAVAVCERQGFVRWGEKARYAFIGDEFIPGYYYAKDLD